MIFKLLFTILLIFSNSVYACTAEHKYSTEETITKSDLIILATVINYKKTKKFEELTSILFEIDDVLYGNTKDNYIKIDGIIVNKSLGNKYKIPYIKGRRRSSGGQCFATDYEYGSTYLLILKNGTPYWTAFSPVNEKVISSTDPWLMWVKGFISGLQFKNKGTNTSKNKENTLGQSS